MTTAEPTETVETISICRDDERVELLPLGGQHSSHHCLACATEYIAEGTEASRPVLLEERFFTVTYADGREVKRMTVGARGDIFAAGRVIAKRLRRAAAAAAADHLSVTITVHVNSVAADLYLINYKIVKLEGDQQ